MRPITLSPLLSLLLAAGLTDSLRADTTIDATARYAYAANGGWIAFKHEQPAGRGGVAVGDAFLSGRAYAANLGWIGFGSGTPDDGIAYSNTTATDWGVNLDGAGNLSGYAYSANTGWFNFDWAASSDPRRPRIDLGTGEFGGFAYSANCGWIKLGGGTLRTVSLRITDTDGDGLADPWELHHFSGDLTATDGSGDADRDGADDRSEYLANTDPNDRGSRFHIFSHRIDTSRSELVIEFTTAPGRSYLLERTGDLQSWRAGAPLALPAGETSASYRIGIGLGADPAARLFRVRVIRPLVQGSP